MNQCTIFLHIYKTGGVTFESIICSRMPQAKRFNFATSPKQGSDALPAKDFELVLGYDLFGVHTSLDLPCRYITFLREPISRCISEYYYAKQHGWRRTKLFPTIEIYAYNHFDVPFWNSKQSLSIGTVSELYHPELMNAITRPERSLGNVEAERILQAAINNMEQHFIIGIMERYHESLLIIAKKMGWSLPIIYKRKNTGATRREPSDQLKSVIAHGSELDQILYSVANEMLDKEIEKYDGDFESDLQLIREET